MDRYAARQLEKKKLAEEKAKKALDEAIKPLNERLNRKQKDALNVVFGFPDPPKQVFALGKDKCAAVWWPYTVPEWVPPPEPETTESKDDGGDESTITSSQVNPYLILSWQVHRYRKDRSVPNGDWLYKGYTVFTNLTKTQIIIEDLANDFEYRFEVKGTNAKGTGSESRPSNPIMVEAPLPSGWFRFYDNEAHRHYYANVKLKKSRWDRPETDPYFLDEAIHFNFQDNEIQALYRLYAEDIAHFNCVTVSQFLDILREVGERCSKSWITKLFRGYAKNEEQLTSWTHFMEIFNHIKRRRVQQSQLIASPIQSFFAFFSKAKAQAIIKPKNFKMGDWKVEYSDLASRYFYKNTVTGESHWSMPPQVKFYIPPKLEEKLLKVFDYGQIEEFQQYFSLLDIDNSGDLSDKEIKLLLSALNINLPENKFQQLIKSVDLNGNGTIEFDEYCWMMYEINRKDKLFEKDSAAKNRPRPRKKDPLGVEEEVNLADNSYHSAEVNIYTDKMFSGKLNFNTMKYTILNFRQNNNSGSGSRIIGAFKSMRGLARSISIKGGHGTLERRYSINSVNSNNTDYHEPQSGRGGGVGGMVRQMSTMFSSSVSRKRTSSSDIANTGQNSRLNSMLSKFDDTKMVDTSVAAIKRRKSLQFAATPSYGAAIDSARHAAEAAALANDRYNREWEEELKRQQAEDEKGFGVFGYAGSIRRTSSSSKPSSPKRASFVDEKLDGVSKKNNKTNNNNNNSNDEADDEEDEEQEEGGVTVEDHPVMDDTPKKYSAFMNRYLPSKVVSLPFEWEKDRPPVSAVKKINAPRIIKPPDYPPPDCDPELLKKYAKMKRQKSRLQAAEAAQKEKEEAEALEEESKKMLTRGSSKANLAGGSLPKPGSPAGSTRSRNSSVHMLGTLQRDGTFSSATGLKVNVSGPPSRANSFRRSGSRRSLDSGAGGDDNSATGGGEGSDADNTPKSGVSRRSSRSKSSLFRSLSSRIMPLFGGESGNESDSSMDSSGTAKKKPHPKHCMCGCRAF